MQDGADAGAAVRGARVPQFDPPGEAAVRVALHGPPALHQVAVQMLAKSVVHDGSRGGIDAAWNGATDPRADVRAGAPLVLEQLPGVTRPRAPHHHVRVGDVGGQLAVHAQQLHQQVLLQAHAARRVDAFDVGVGARVLQRHAPVHEDHRVAGHVLAPVQHVQARLRVDQCQVVSVAARVAAVRVLPHVQVGAALGDAQHFAVAVRGLGVERALHLFAQAVVAAADAARVQRQTRIQTVVAAAAPARPVHAHVERIQAAFCAVLDTLGQ